MYLSEKLIQYSFDNNAKRSLAFFALLKRVKVNGQIHDYSLSTVSKLTGISISQVRVYLSQLKNLGLLHTHHDSRKKSRTKKTLVIHNHTNNFLGIKAKHLCKISITEEDTIDSIIQKFQVKIIEYKKRQQINIAKQKRDIYSIHNPNILWKPSQLRKIQRNIREERFAYSGFDSNITFSDLYLSKLFNQSRSTFNKHKRVLFKKGLLFYTTSRTRIMKCALSYFNQFKQELINEFGGIFWYKGSIYKQSASCYGMIETIAQDKDIRKRKIHG